MSDYNWKEKQIRKAYETHQHKKDWLNTRAIRSGISAADVRQLMKIMVERGYAFDNQTSQDSDRYSICFNLDEKERIVEELEDSMEYSPFDNLAIIGAVMDKFFAGVLADRIETKEQLVAYFNLKLEWACIYAGLLRHQEGKNVNEFKLSCLLKIANTSEYFDMYLFDRIAPFMKILNRKDRDKYISIKILVFIKIYKALKIGWNDIAHLYPNRKHNMVFISLIEAYFTDKIVQCSNPRKPKYWTYLPKLVTIKNFPGFMKKHLIFLSENKNSDETSRDFYKAILEGYERDPQGQGLDKALAAFKELAEKDTYVAGELKEYYKALSFFGAYPDLKSFDDFLQCPNPGYSLHHNDIELTDYAVAYQASHIKEALLQSPNSRVRKAVSEWLGVSEDIIAFERTHYQRNAVRKKTPIDKNL